MELNNGAEGGTATTTVSAANSGGASGNAFDSVVGTPTITFDNTQARGTLAYKVVAGASAQQVVWSSASVGTVGQLYGRFYLYSNAAPSAVTGLVRFTVGGSQTARLRYESTGLLTLADAGNSPEIQTVSAIPTGQWIRVEFQITFTPATGTCDLRTYNTPDSTTATESLNSTSLNAATNCDQVQWGSFNGVTWTGWLDGLNINTTGFPGPIVGRPPAPAISRGALVRAARW